MAIFTFLLNFVWESAQVPLFAEMPLTPHWLSVQICARATVGDVAIALAAFSIVAAMARSRAWILAATPRQLTAFVAVGVVVTVVMEWLATHWLGRWTYAETMPIVPGLEVGLAPLLQWLVIPPLVVWFVRRQLKPRA